LPFAGRDAAGAPAAKKQRASDSAPVRPVFYRAPYLSAWHTET
jgi:hypothetical protein